MKKAIIFDMDGVLVNTPNIASEASNVLLKEHDLKFSQEEFKEYLKFSIGERVKLWNEKYGLKIDEEIFFTKFVDLQMRLLEDEIKTSDVQSVILSLKESKFKIGLATKAKKIKVDKILSALKISDLFDSIVTGNDTDLYKPHPDAYLISAKNLNLKSEECLVVEDSPHGIVSAKAAGMEVLALKTKLFTEEDLQEADNIIYNLNEIQKYLN